MQKLYTPNNPTHMQQNVGIYTFKRVHVQYYYI